MNLQNIKKIIENVIYKELPFASIDEGDTYFTVKPYATAVENDLFDYFGYDIHDKGERIDALLWFNDCAKKMILDIDIYLQKNLHDH